MAPPGDPKHIAADIPNPFGESIPRLSTFTAQEIATLQSRLDKQLGPEYISTRSGPGGSKVSYITAEKVINLANEVFGFNGWSSGIRDVTIDYVDMDKSTGKISLGCSIIVRVTLKDGTYHEDVGYGSITNCSTKGAAFEKAKKEAATDAMKRALRSFGNVLGNCLYDKEYIGKINRVKALPSRWTEEKLHRHPDFAPIKKSAADDTPTEKDSSNEKNTSQARRTSSVHSHVSAAVTDYDDEFGNDLFEEVDFHSDDVLVENSLLDTDVSETTPVAARQPIPRMQSMPQMRTSGPAQAQGNYQQGQGNTAAANQALARQQQQQQRPGQPPNNNMNGGRSVQNGGRMQPPQQQQPDQKQQAQQRPAGMPNQQQNTHISNQQPQTRATSSTPEQLAQNNQRPVQPPQQQGRPSDDAPPPHNAPVGFITARAAEQVHASNVPLPPNAPAFNPHADSPSIRKTTGVDHRRSGPVTREVVGAKAVPPLNLQPATTTTAHGTSALAGFGAPPANRSMNVINPQADANRRIGMPGAGQSPMANRTAYKAPTMTGIKRGPEGLVRPPLADVSNGQQQQGDGGAGDEKRQRVVGGGS
ncbi:hypothetical protein EJ08DRAFT_649514 [Tothia fuscella]|uniref:RAD52 homolog n=1 Tax=Tothia fuscella TaxID=1048955 RepID=A0A9P4NSN8_9PEZI|nr:hypothetical protein EJ08DRAFT_649514 [Tothia fuscella]